MPKRKRKLTPQQQKEQGDAALLLLLLDLFSVVNDVFTEEDALKPEKRQMSLGRIYRAWGKFCRELDPDFDSATYIARKKVYLKQKND